MSALKQTTFCLSVLLYLAKCDFMRISEPELPRYTVPTFLIHSSCEIINCCFKQLILGIVCYTAIDN